MRTLALFLILLATPALAAPSPAHITSNGPTPTADCGTVAGTDSAGVVTVTTPQANPSVCVLTFAQAWGGSVPPACLGGFVFRPPSDMSTAQPILFVSSTSIAFHYGDLGSQQADQLFVGDTFSYMCIGH